MLGEVTYPQASQGDDRRVQQGCQEDGGQSDLTEATLQEEGSFTAEEVIAIRERAVVRVELVFEDEADRQRPLPRSSVPLMPQREPEA